MRSDAERQPPGMNSCWYPVLLAGRQNLVHRLEMQGIIGITAW